MKIFGLLLITFGAITSVSMSVSVVSGKSPLSIWAAADIVLGGAAVIIGIMMIAHNRQNNRLSEN